MAQLEPGVFERDTWLRGEYRVDATCIGGFAPVPSGLQKSRGNRGGQPPFRAMRGRDCGFPCGADVVEDRPFAYSYSIHCGPAPAYRFSKLMVTSISSEPALAVVTWALPVKVSGGLSGRLSIMFSPMKSG